MGGTAWAVWRFHRGGRVPAGIRAAVTALAGIALCAVRYRPDPNTVVHGAPLPLVILQRERGGPWLDYVAPGPVVLIIAALNMLVAAGVIHGLGCLALWWSRTRVHTDA